MEALAGDWWVDRKGEIPTQSNGKPYFNLPIFNYHKVRQGTAPTC